jgi:hypothetical protein
MPGKTATALTLAARRGQGVADGGWCAPGAEHVHRWVRLPGTVGLFVCRDEACLWAAVCPGCLGSLDVALAAQVGIDGMGLFWCAFHRGEAGT